MQQSELLSKVVPMPHFKGEDKLANEIALYLKHLSAEEKLNGVWFHVPNQHVIRSKNDIFQILKKSALGMIPGAPDLVFMNAETSLLVELKVGKNKLSENQVRFCRWADKASIPYVIARSLEDLKLLLTQHGFLNENN